MNSWGSNKEDALTFRIGCSQKDTVRTVIRGNVFEKHIEKSNFYLTPDRWETIRITLSGKEIFAAASGQEIVRASLNGVDFPQKWHIGIIGYRPAIVEIQGLDVYEIY